MNAIAEEFNSVYADSDDEIMAPKEIVKAPTISHPVELRIIKPLSGYESTMRRHAAACEAGR